MARITQRLGMTRYDADEYYRQALDAFKKGRYDAAINAVNEAIALLPTHAEYYAARGLMYHEDGVKEKAQADFEKALKLYPGEMLAHYGRGMIAYKDRNWDEALAHFQDAYRANPQRPETLYYLSILYHRKGNNPAARQLMEMAIKEFGEGSEYVRHRADAQRWVKEFDKILGIKS